MKERRVRCKQCGERFTVLRFERERTSAYCDLCREDRKREQARERMRTMRARLTKHIHRCLTPSCGAERSPEPPDEAVDTVEGEKGDRTFQVVMRELRPPPGVYGWQEHDGRDEPEPIAVMLCTACSNRLIDPHPRVYVRISRRAPFPGIMDLCIDCRHRAGVTCTHSDRVSNGGEGLQVDAALGMGDRQKPGEDNPEREVHRGDVSGHADGDTAWYRMYAYTRGRHRKADPREE